MGDAATFIDGLLSSSARTFEDCVLARPIADRFNIGDMLADFDRDWDVDLSDYTVLADCLAGPNATPNPVLPNVTIQDCLDVFDAEPDGDMDMNDFAELQTAFTVVFHSK